MVEGARRGVDILEVGPDAERLLDVAVEVGALRRDPAIVAPVNSGDVNQVFVATQWSL